MNLHRCRYCGRSLPKRTVSHYFGQPSQSKSRYYVNHPERPRSKAEVQQLVKGQVVSVRWARGEQYGAKQAGFDFITRASTWDGESYADKYFCSKTHASEFGYVTARDGLSTQAYKIAVQK